ncbi:MAG: bifunctional phosphoglucose/phosphomannose isomerase [Melioribacteraceae bacterium]|nr:bifunctional phosphoglucose/phosphomannose isomerase [Melioribacteraceae bacterium]
MTTKEMVSKFDVHNQFDVLVKTYEQIEYVMNNDFELNEIDTAQVKNIIVSGLGGSAIAADFVKDIMVNELSIPIAVNRTYTIPAYVNVNTLFIASSYSGNTEETLNAASEALTKGAKIICITTGGKLAEFASKNNLNVIYLKKGYQPRYAFGVNFFTLLNIINKLNLSTVYSKNVELAAKLIKELGVKYSEEDNYPLAIAEKVAGHIPIIYSVSDNTSSLGMRFKSQFNENAKLHSFQHYFPEMNHNEIIGWETYNTKQLNAIVIFLKDITYHEQIKKRFTIVKELLEKAGTEVIEIQSNQESYFLRLIELVYLTDWITYYTAIVRGSDPSEIDFINYLKDHL